MVCMICMVHACIVDIGGRARARTTRRLSQFENHNYAIDKGVEMGKQKAASHHIHSIHDRLTHSLLTAICHIIRKISNQTPPLRTCIMAL